MLKRAEWTAAVLLTVAVGGLHLLRLLHAGGLWRDEAAAVALATLPTVREIARRPSGTRPFRSCFRSRCAAGRRCGAIAISHCGVRRGGGPRTRRGALVKAS